MVEFGGIKYLLYVCKKFLLYGNKQSREGETFERWVAGILYETEAETLDGNGDNVGGHS